MTKDKSGDSHINVPSCWVTLIELVRGAVLDQQPIVSEDIVIDWDALLALASEQSVIPWVWDGLNRLPKNQQPSRLHKINWGLSAHEGVQAYNKQLDILKQMINICTLNGIKVLLLKGFGLSELYPNPSSRVCGDIDIYLFGDYEKGNELFCRGNYIYGAGDKHANFKYRSVTIENHYSIINTNTAQQKRVEKYLESELDRAELTSDGYFILPPLANIIFLLMHSLSHMESQVHITLRNIVDFGMLMNNNRTRLVPSECMRQLHQLKLTKSFELLLSLSEEVLGLNFEDYHEKIISKHDVQRLLSMIAEKNTSMDDVSMNISLFEQIRLRKAYYRKMKWKYKYIPFSQLHSYLHIFIPPITHCVKRMIMSRACM